MTKGLKALGRIRVFMSQNCKHWKQDIGYVEEELKDGAKCRKALEIIKNALKEMGLEYIISSETMLLHGDDFEREYKCKSAEEFDLLKEALG